AEQEIRGNQHGANARFNSFIEGAALALPLVETHQRGNVGRRHRPAISAARKVGENLPRTRFILRGCRWMADKNLLSAWRVARAGWIVRPKDRNTIYVALTASNGVEQLHPDIIQPEIQFLWSTDARSTTSRATPADSSAGLLRLR